MRTIDIFKATEATAADPAANARDDDDGWPWGKLIDTAVIPGGGHLHLVRHDDDYEILFDDEQLMGSWAFLSEEALATVVLGRLGKAADRILIGGLGMGFTLAAARAALPATTKIVVAELVPQVLAWARGPLAHIVGNSLADPRVSIELRDVHDLIVEQPAGFDVILLDVDNGPDGLIHIANERLYSSWGLRATHAALRSGGILAVWSAYRDPAFAQRLDAAGFDVEEMEIASGGYADDPPHVIWLAVRRLG